MPSSVDTYYHLLERPSRRTLDACAERHEHVSPSFDRGVYERSRGRAFASLEDAYGDWVSVGRKLGSAFAEGRDTLLKIVLKVKDEVALFPIWMDYHRSIVGLHNIVIVDCGSTDPRFLEMLASYAGQAVVLTYGAYYDDLHDVRGNRPFYDLVCANARYITVLDADEFLFGHRGGRLGRREVLDTLREADVEAFAGTWFPNVRPPNTAPDGLLLGEALTFNIEQHILKHGTVAGKSVIRTDAMPRVQNIGHNLHVKTTIDLFSAGSFGRLCVLHLSRLDPALTRSRVLKHLRAKRVVGPGATDEDTAALLLELLSRGALSGVEELYAKRFLGRSVAGDEASQTFATRILSDPRSEMVEAFSTRVDAFDFEAVLREYRQGAVAPRP